jgi:hypothetical protein
MVNLVDGAIRRAKKIEKDTHGLFNVSVVVNLFWDLISFFFNILP